MTTTDDGSVLRFAAKLVQVERRSQSAVVTFAIHVGPESDTLAENIGEPVLLGVLFERDAAET